MRISDCSSDVCSSDLAAGVAENEVVAAAVDRVAGRDRHPGRAMWVDAEVKAADHAPAIAVADACEPAVGPAHEGVQVILGQLLTAVELGPDATVELAARRRIAGRAARVGARVPRGFRSWGTGG